MSERRIDFAQPCLIADIGGTNARFALAYPNTNQKYDLGTPETFRCASFDSFEALLAHFLSLVDGEKPKQAVFAVAGPVSGDEFSMTNLGWRFSIRSIEEKLGWHALVLVNDFVAQAYAALSLEVGQATVLTAKLNSKKDMSNSNSFPKNPNSIHSPMSEAPKVVLGPGTGLGVAGLINNGRRWKALPSEGGHMRAAATTDLMAHVIEFLRQEKPLEYVSYENILSGPGLENIYRALQHVNGVHKNTSLSAADISQQALSKQCDLAQQAVLLFTHTLASFAGDVALMMCARGGVFIGGGIFSRWLDGINHGDFLQNFRDKGQMSGFLRDVPVTVMTGQYLALQGLCEWLSQNKKLT